MVHFDNSHHFDYGFALSLPPVSSSLSTIITSFGLAVGGRGKIGTGVAKINENKMISSDLNTQIMSCFQ
jgi:hypothetical protein